MIERVAFEGLHAGVQLENVSLTLNTAKVI